MADLIKYSDSLRKGTDKLNDSIKDSNTAFLKANQAAVISEAAKILAESVQEQFNQVVIEGDSSVEAAQARVDSGGVPHPTLKSRLDNFEFSATQQLAHTAELADKTEYNTMGKGKSDVRPVITFVTDDARTQDWTIFREMFAEVGLPVSTAVSPNRNINTPDYGDVYLTVDKIRELQDDYGWEILSHLWDHEDLTTLTDTELDHTLKESRNWLRDNGFNGYEFLMYPFGRYDERVKRFTAKYYKAARTTAGLWGGVDNKFPFSSYQLSARFFSQTISLDILKADVDRCIANKTWLNLFFHSWEIDDWNREADFRALLDYVKSKQLAGLVDVMGYKDTYERYGNTVDQSSYALESDDMFIIQSNGKVRSNIAKTKKLADNSVTNDSLPSDFPANFLSFVTITQADKGFPTTNGTLETLYFTPNENEPTNMRYTRQTFYPYTSSQVYTRSYLASGWTNWVLQGSGGSTGSGGFAIITGSSVDGTTIPSAFPEGQLTLYSKGSNTVGMPTTLGGVLSVYKVSTSFSFWYQEFKVVGSNDVWRRYATSDSAWATWVRVEWASGITANRPTGIVTGYSYFDGTIGKPIWFKGSGVWVDSTGLVV